MIIRIIFFIFGILITSISICFITIYLNLLNMGYTFYEYLKLVFTRLECIMFFIGIFFIFISMFKKGKRKWFLFMIFY